MRALLLLLPFLSLGAHAQDEVQLRDQRFMWVELNWGEDGQPLLSIQAKDVSAEALTRLIARRLNISRVEGFDQLDDDPHVTVNVTLRPAEQVLRWTLGTVGLTAVVGNDALVVAPDVGANPDGKAMLRKATTRYLDALRRFPDYPDADRAQMARATIAERLGQEEWSTAVLNYDQLIEEYPHSDLVPEALQRCGHLYGEMGVWDQAILRYEELSRREDPHPYHAIARLELADALCHRGETESEPAVAVGMGNKALYVLEALDASYPTKEPQQRYERLLVQARAHALAGNGIRALQTLDAAARYSRAGVKDARILELRARALEHAGELAAASSAWLAWAESMEGQARIDGYQRAARAALRAGEDLAVLMIHARAEELGFGDELASAEAQARATLGLPVTTASALDPAADLARGENHVTARRWKAAREVLRGVYQQRSQLSPEEEVRLATAYAKSLHKLGHEEAAIDVLRAIVGDLDKEPLRRQLYLLAADLYENRTQPRFDLAVEALKGRL